MVKKLLLIILLSLFVSTSAQAKIHAYAGFGINYASLGTARIGFGDWEIGKYASRSFAINKLFHLSKSVYGSLGAGFVGNGAGMVASFGYNWDLWLGFGLRTELYAEQSFSNYSSGAALLGLSFNF